MCSTVTKWEVRIHRKETASIHQWGFRYLIHLNWQKGCPREQPAVHQLYVYHRAYMRTRILARPQIEGVRWTFRVFHQSFLDNVFVFARTGWRFSSRAPPHFFRKSTPQRSSAVRRRSLRFSPMPRSQLRDQAGLCNRLPTVAPYIVTLRFVSLIDRERNREFLPRFRAVIAKIHARRVGQVETDEPDLPTAYWQKSPSLHETARWWWC